MFNKKSTNDELEDLETLIEHRIKQVSEIGKVCAFPLDEVIYSLRLISNQVFERLGGNSVLSTTARAVLINHYFQEVEILVIKNVFGLNVTHEEQKEIIRIMYGDNDGN